MHSKVEQNIKRTDMKDMDELKNKVFFNEFLFYRWFYLA